MLFIYCWLLSSADIQWNEWQNFTITQDWEIMFLL